MSGYVAPITVNSLLALALDNEIMSIMYLAFRQPRYDGVDTAITLE